ncbi:ZnMc domain-containing protein [Mycena indigotica]|uniref:ZnMc domain-containing protein n=1 Tax=Mycena indigotica TaxID=2126181 RepID=A0A8H6SGZ6_9AGAR|nr:ZnMc domain-containing protein [Mycena indigotica]KAF7299383.1 ZnMc domain-containing protein [Mycena indigotica]
MAKSERIQPPPTPAAIGGPAGSQQDAVNAKVDGLWDSGATVTYSFIEGTQNQQEKVDKVLLEWLPYANIAFQREAVGTVRISFDPHQASWSYVGNASKEIPSPAPTMNLGSVADTTTITVSDRGAILHQFGHCLGLLHEHHNPTAGGGVTLKEEAVYAYYTAAQGWNKETIKQRILDVYNTTDVSNYSEIDMASIMKYPIPSELTVEGVAVETNQALSPQDMAYMVINYPRPTPHASAPQWTLDHALEVSATGKDAAAEISAAHKAGDIASVRALFATFQASARINQSPAAPKVDPISNPPAAKESPDEWCLTLDDQQNYRGISPKQLLWLPHQQIRFGFFDSNQRGCEATEFRKTRVRNALKLYMRHTSLVFIEVEDDEFRSLDFSKVSDRVQCPLRIAFGEPETVGGKVRYGWSQNGKKLATFEFAGPGNVHSAPGPRYATMWLGGQPWIESTAQENGRATAAIYHELGHVLGLSHPADSKNLQNVANSLRSSLVDPMSIMISTSRDANSNTIPSPTDLDLLRLLYPDNGSSNGKFAAALNAFNFSPDDRSNLLALAERVIGERNKIDEGLIGILWSSIATAFNQDYRRGRLSTSAPVLNDLAYVSGPLIDPEFEPANVWCASAICDDAVSKTSVTRPSSHRHLESRDQLWLPHERITYGFLPSLGPERETAPTEYRKRFVREVIAQYTKHTSLIFEEVSDTLMGSADFWSEADRHRVDIRIAFGGPVQKTAEKWVWGWSYTGADARKFDGLPKAGALAYATTFLAGLPHGSPHEVSKEHLAEATRAVYHEVGHIFGLSHQSEAPTSATPNNIGQLLVASMIDPDSVMLYRNKPFPKASQLSTYCKSNPTPSATDLALLRLMYPDNGTANSAFAHALRQMQFSSTDIQSLLAKVALAIARPSQVNATEIKKIRSSIALDINLAPRIAKPIADIHLRERTGEENNLVAPNAGGEVGILADSDTAESGGQATGFLYELVQNLKQFFNPGQSQQFTLQFPGRFLDQNSYAWNTADAGINGQFVKPTVVNEAEFRLADQLYDLSDVVGGPNGTNLSIVYEQLLNNLLPKFVPNGLGTQQAEIRDWLTQDVPMSQWMKDIQARHRVRERERADALALLLGTKTAEQIAAEHEQEQSASGDDSENNKETINRIELSQLLMNEYLYTKQDWQTERDALMKHANAADLGTAESAKALDELARKLSHITASRQALLAEKYNDAVVRGHSHTIKEYLGYLDIASPAEALQSAKDSLRESAMSSLDGSMKVYPIQLTPLDWFEGLSTSFTMEDLTQDPELIRQQIGAKSQQRDTLTSQLVSLQLGENGNPAELEKKVKDEQGEVDTAKSNLLKTYTSNIVETAKTCLNAAGKVNIEALALLVKKTPDFLKPIEAMMEKLEDAQARLTASSRALTDIKVAHALAKASDTKDQQQQITLRIQSLTEELNQLQLRWKTLTANSTEGGAKPNPRPDRSKEEIPKTPIKLPGESSSGGSRWQTIAFTSSSQTRKKLTQNNASATSKQWSCNLWFASASGSASSESADSSQKTTASDDTIELAFRATLVTVDRGGWFQPQFFKQSNAFYKVNKDISWTSKVKNEKDKVTGLMPGFPIAFILAKDIVIRITHGTSQSEDRKKYDSHNSAASGGILCFSYAQSSSSSSEASSSNYEAYSNGFVVKIPGPQILGYMVQKLNSDEGEMMPSKLPDGFLIPDKQYEKGKAKEKEQEAKEKEHEAKARQESSPAVTHENLKDVVARMMEDKIEDLFHQLKDKGGEHVS